MKLLLLLLALPMFCFGQNVNIPDANFKAYLVGNSVINTNGDNQIQVSEASAFNGEIYCNSMNISNLTGIEAFTALTYLMCYGNQLTSLDVSTCTALTGLSCYGNQLTSLDVSTCTALIDLFCFNNQLTSLDVSQNTALTQLNCFNNQLTSLDVRNGNNTNFYFFDSSNNPNLTCINVDDATWSTPYWLYIDSQHYFSNNCSGAGISDINESNTLMLYPNPTNGDFTITGLELVGTVSSLSLTDMNGKVVKVLDSKSTKFSMASIKPGVYFLNIISGNKQEVLKIVKE